MTKHKRMAPAFVSWDDALQAPVEQAATPGYVDTRETLYGVDVTIRTLGDGSRLLHPPAGLVAACWYQTVMRANPPKRHIGKPGAVIVIDEAELLRDQPIDMEEL